MKAILSTCTLIAVLAVATGSASAQAWTPGDAKVGKIAVEIQQTPQFQAGNVKDKNIPRPKGWIEVEVEFELSDRRIKEDFVDQVMVRYYIVVKGENGPKMMTGDVTHSNVPTGEDVYSIAYVPPSVLDKMMGKDSSVSPSDVQAVGVAIYINGAEIARGGEGQKAGWWTETSLQQESGILAKSKTPFSLLWIDRHAGEVTSGN